METINGSDSQKSLGKLYRPSSWTVEALHGIQFGKSHLNALAGSMAQRMTESSKDGVTSDPRRALHTKQSNSQSC